MDKYPWQARDRARKAEKKNIKTALDYKKKIDTPPIKNRSVKGSAEDALYNKIAVKFKKENPFCMAKLTGCQIHTTDVHHKKGRGIWLLIVKWFLPVCRSCHIWIGDNHEKAVELGLSASRLEK